MNGLSGRMLNLPSKNPKYNREILLLCGHHSSIERMDAFIEVFNDYGNVTVPDLPGFGGMEPFYKIGKKPTIDNYADYLAAFIKLRYKRKKFVVIGMSFSVPVFVRMLQKYPQLQDRVEFCVSLSGFVHKEDFRFNKFELGVIKYLVFIFSRKSTSYLVGKVLLKEKVIQTVYKVDYLNRKNRKSDLASIKSRIKLDSRLWAINDFRTAIYTYYEMMSIDLCDVQVKSQIYHLTSEADHFFHKEIVEQHMQIIFKNFHSTKTTQNVHVPAIDAPLDVVKSYIPEEVHKRLKMI